MRPVAWPSRREAGGHRDPSHNGTRTRPRWRAPRRRGARRGGSTAPGDRAHAGLGERPGARGTSSSSAGLTGSGTPAEPEERASRKCSAEAEVGRPCMTTGRASCAGRSPGSRASCFQTISTSVRPADVDRSEHLADLAVEALLPDHDPAFGEPEVDARCRGGKFRRGAHLPEVPEAGASPFGMAPDVADSRCFLGRDPAWLGTAMMRTIS